jgi:serine/threonine protein kinase
VEQLSPDDPSRIGGYHLLGRLGEGGMGVVYLARSDRGRTVAVKSIRGELTREPHFRRRFAREITAARRVGGAWTAAVLDADGEAPAPWVATEFIAALPLLRVVSAHGPLPERSVLLLAGGLAQALAAIHGAGVLHRDLKPSNVLMSMDGPRVIDFGIARALEPAERAEPAERLTRTGSVVGSPGFMSPEQVRSAPLTTASDVFCLGSLLTYAATGRTPFGALNSGRHQLMYRTVEEEPDLADVPEALRGLIAGCLARDPDERTPVARLLAACPAPGGGGGTSQAPEGLGEDSGPWLPAEIVMAVARSAVSVLDTENPSTRPIWSDTTVPPPAPAHAPVRPEEPGQPERTDLVVPRDPPFVPPSPVALPSHGSADPPAPRPAPRPRRGRRAVLAVLAALAAVALAVAGVTAVVALAGGDDDGDADGGGDDDGSGPATAIPDAYLGNWQGEYGTRGEPGWRALWLQIHHDRQGETVGAATVTYMDTTCVYDIRLSAVHDDRLDYTEVADYGIPEDEGPEKCRVDHGVQSLRLQKNGELRWANAELQVTLQPAGDSTRDHVPGSLLSSWRGEYSTEEFENVVQEVTIEQGAVGDTVMRWRWTADGETCVVENELALVTGDRILLSPDIVVEEEPDTHCEPWESHWAWVKDDRTLHLQEAGPRIDPASFEFPERS